MCSINFNFLPQPKDKGELAKTVKGQWKVVGDVQGCKLKEVPSFKTPENVSLQVIEPLPPRGPTKPAKIPYYIGLDNMDADILASKEKMSKRNLINENLMLLEALDAKTRTDWGGKQIPDEDERSQNPFKRAEENLSFKDAIIYRPEKHLHRTNIAVQGVGVGHLGQFNRVQILDANLRPTKNSLFIHSTEILPVIAQTREDELKEEIRGLKKKVRQLEKGKDKPKPKQVSGASENKNPEKVGDHGIASPHSDSAGTENPKIVKEKPERCDICNGRYKNKNSLYTHRSEAHGGKNGQRKTKVCDECGIEFETLLKYHRHECMEEKRRKKKMEDMEKEIVKNLKRKQKEKKNTAKKPKMTKK